MGTVPVLKPREVRRVLLVDRSSFLTPIVIDREFTVELEYLTAFDAARRRLAEIVDMPDQRLDLFIRLIVVAGPNGSIAAGR